jgi:hypothetical protein
MQAFKQFDYCQYCKRGLILQAKLAVATFISGGKNRQPPHDMKRDETIGVEKR